MKALDQAGCKYTLSGADIVTQRTDYWGAQTFVFEDGRYFFKHDKTQWGLSNIGVSGHREVHDFLGGVQKNYDAIIAETKDGEEKARIERERQEYVARQRESVLTKAKEMGFEVREEKVQSKIKLVLVRTT
jgi:CRISPR/Cas system-associated protein Cas10 (large subunit of type III CRISPR-Cas system)